MIFNNWYTEFGYFESPHEYVPKSDNSDYCKCEMPRYSGVHSTTTSYLTVNDIREIVKKGMPVTDVQMKVNSKSVSKWLPIIWKDRMVEINGKGKIREIKNKRKKKAK